jgi:hypothetical protein
MRSFLMGVLSFSVSFSFYASAAQAVTYKCVVVAKTKNGTGRRIAVTRGVGTATWRPRARYRRIVRRKSRACRAASIKCNAKLFGRRLIGKNRRARCVIVRG